MSNFDNSLYVRSNSGSPIFIILYMDDLVIGSEELVDINKVKSLLSSKFKMDMKELHYFLGIMISQRHYILNLLFKFGMTTCKFVASPLNWNLKLDANVVTTECY